MRNQTPLGRAYVEPTRPRPMNSIQSASMADMTRMAVLFGGVLLIRR
jgi:hypothetical protein